MLFSVLLFISTLCLSINSCKNNSKVEQKQVEAPPVDPENWYVKKLPEITWQQRGFYLVKIDGKEYIFVNNSDGVAICPK